MSKTVAERTIDDFARQHETYADSTGYYTSTDILADVFGPLMSVDDVRGMDVVDLGSGTGRWVRIFHDVGARTITSVEPSRAIEVCREKNADLDNVTYHNVTGENMPDGPYDMVYSFGVVHHIPEPDPVMKRAHDILKPGGRAVVWLYGREGNGLYLAFMHALRLITVPMPDRGLDWISLALVPCVRFYSAVSRVLPLPLRRYMREFVDKVDNYTIRHVIYDQLDPHYAKYYRRAEAIDLLQRAGFSRVEAYHRAAYSWTVMGFKDDA